MARPSNSFSRDKPRYKEQPKVLVICEDSKSGLLYLQDARSHFRVDVDVEISHCRRTDPKGIVEEAINRENGFDQVYCVIDRDSHPSFDEAIALARTSHKVCTIASFPCFEFWLLLHFGHCRKPYTAVGDKSSADLLIRDLCQKVGMEGYNKGADQHVFATLLGERFILARKLAPKILAEAIDEGNLNPSTQLHILIDKLERLASPQLLE